MTDAAQLPLGFDHRPSMSGVDFLVAECNRAAVAWLDKWPDWPGPALVVHGPPASGKTHVAHVFQAQTGGTLVQGDELDDEVVRGAQSDGRVVIVDDADKSVDEAILFHLYNVAADGNSRLLLTAGTPPARWNIGLPDLASRLRAAPSVGIRLPDDDLMAAVLTKQFSDRQLRVDPAVISFLLPRIERSFSALDKLVDDIDRASLAEKRNVTLPFVRTVLAGRAGN